MSTTIYGAYGVCDTSQSPISEFDLEEFIERMHNSFYLELARSLDSDIVCMEMPDIPIATSAVEDMHYMSNNYKSSSETLERIILNLIASEGNE